MNSFDSSLEQDSQLGADANEKEGENYHSSSLANLPLQKRKIVRSGWQSMLHSKNKAWKYNIPRNPSSEFQSLGQWCSNIKTCLQEDTTSQDSLVVHCRRIRLLEAFGFESLD